MADITSWSWFYFMPAPFIPHPSADPDLNYAGLNFATTVSNGGYLAGDVDRGYGPIFDGTNLVIPYPELLTTTNPDPVATYGANIQTQEYSGEYIGITTGLSLSLTTQGTALPGQNPYSYVGISYLTAEDPEISTGPYMVADEYHLAISATGLSGSYPSDMTGIRSEILWFDGVALSMTGGPSMQVTITAADTVVGTFSLSAPYYGATFRYMTVDAVAVKEASVISITSDRVNYLVTVKLNGDLPPLYEAIVALPIHDIGAEVQTTVATSLNYIATFEATKWSILPGYAGSVTTDFWENFKGSEQI